MSEYHLRPSARKDLSEIWHYTDETWSQEHADRYLNALFDKFEFLADHPRHGGSAEHIRIGYRHERCNKHMIYYRLIEDGIEIVRILHMRQDAKRQLSE